MSSIQLELHDFERDRAGSIAEKIEELERPWRSREVLEYCYVEEGESTYEVADKTGCSQMTVLRWLQRHDVPVREPSTEAAREARGGPWRDPDTLHEKYIEEGLSTTEIAEELGCGTETVRGNLVKNGIETRDQAEATRKACRVERASYSIDRGGYPRWVADDPDGRTVTVFVHQLLACLDNDPNEVWEDGTHCHHSTAHPAANVPGLIEVLSRSEHSSLHKNGEWRFDDDGWPILTMPEGDGFSTISVNRHETEA